MRNQRMNELFDIVLDNLPTHVQLIYEEAFNNAWEAYADSEERDEEAHKAAWAELKRSYRNKSLSLQQRAKKNFVVE
ncbi:MAG: ChaB family protein [Sulfuricaulis sp.]